MPLKKARAKGTVTSLSSVFPADEAQKAAQRVKDNIAEKQKQLDNLHTFVNDNTDLINLVHRLPDELNHQIMVPFGKAAFFPGRLVHTNEFMVLLGEGYFAERSAKQTVDILKRRGNMLDSEVESLEAVIEDLKTEASFFDRTASEAAEGLVEIREDYVDDDDDDDDNDDDDYEGSGGYMSTSGQEKADVQKAPVTDNTTGGVDAEEYARMMARLNELEKEELELGDGEEEDEDNYDEDRNIEQKSLSLQPMHKESDESSYGKALPHTLLGKSAVNHVPSVQKTSVQPLAKSKPEVGVSKSNQDAESEISEPYADSLKAFTGSIIERTVNLPTDSKKETNQPSKPVSRFKMQRRGGQA